MSYLMLWWKISSYLRHYSIISKLFNDNKIIKLRIYKYLVTRKISEISNKNKVCFKIC